MTAEWVPPDVDSDKPSVARVYDYLLGGTHNFASDRDLATGLLRIEPQARELAKANRAFLSRAVQVLIASGVHQFIDIGSGIPTVGNVHEIAQASDPSARIVYVDNDPVAVAHSRSILAGNGQTAVIQADMRRTAELLDLVAELKLLDLSQPVGILLVAALHLIKDDEDPYAIVTQLRSAMAPGSHLVISHLTDDDRPGKLAAIEKLYKRATSPAVARRRSEVLDFFDGFDLLEPGLVYVPLWRPDVLDAAARNGDGAGAAATGGAADAGGAVGTRGAVDAARTVGTGGTVGAGGAIDAGGAVGAASGAVDASGAVGASGAIDASGAVGAGRAVDTGGAVGSESAARFLLLGGVGRLAAEAPVS